MTPESVARTPQVPALLDLPLPNDPDGLISALLDKRCWGEAADQRWLYDRYAEIAPAIIPAVLVCLRDGSALTDHTRKVIVESARGCREHTVAYSTILRGGIPALSAFMGFVRRSDCTVAHGQAVLLMSRAALLAQELAACWAEAWRPVSAPEIFDDTCDLSIEAADGALDSPALEMVTLAAAGWSNERIARELSYSAQAVKWHLARLMRTWGVPNRTALVAVAVVRGAVRGRPRTSTRRGHTRNL